MRAVIQKYEKYKILPLDFFFFFSAMNHSQNISARIEIVGEKDYSSTDLTKIFNQNNYYQSIT